MFQPPGFGDGDGEGRISEPEQGIILGTSSGNTYARCFFAPPARCSVLLELEYFLIDDGDHSTAGQIPFHVYATNGTSHGGQC